MLGQRIRVPKPGATMAALSDSFSTHQPLAMPQIDGMDGVLRTGAELNPIGLVVKFPSFPSIWPCLRSNARHPLRRAQNFKLGQRDDSGTQARRD